jgi:toxin YoeB
MGRYQLEVKLTAQKDLQKIYKSGDSVTISRVEQIFAELETHPETGAGKPEKLRHELSGFWSRRLNKKDRIISELLTQKLKIN